MTTMLQHYVANSTDGTNSTVVLSCGGEHQPQRQEDCILSRIALLLTTFHYKAWIFGAAYYWLIWVFLAAVLAGSLFSLYKLP